MKTKLLFLVAPLFVALATACAAETSDPTDPTPDTTQKEDEQTGKVAQAITPIPIPSVISTSYVGITPIPIPSVTQTTLDREATTTR